MRAVSSSCWALVAALALTGLARADGAPTEEQLAAARQAFSDGVAAQDQGHYAEALTLYESASRVAVSPQLLYNMATCREQLGRLKDARADYERASTAAHARGDGEVEREATERIAAIDARIPHLVVHAPDELTDLTATLDGKPIGLAELSRLALDPGSHRLMVRSASRPREFEASFDLAPGGDRVLDVDLGPPSPPASAVIVQPSPPVVRSPTYWPAFVATGAALAFGAGAIATGIAGHSAYDDYLGLNANPTDANLSRREDLRASGQALYVANAIFIGVAVVALGVAAYFFVRPPKVSTSTAAAHVNVAF